MYRSGEGPSVSLQPVFLAADGGLDYDRIVTEVVPIANLMLLFAAVSLPAFVLGLLVGPELSVLFFLVGQFVLVVGGAVLLMYVIVRALQFHEERESAATDGSAGR